MANVFERIDSELQEWLDKQHIFFVSTAPLATDGLVNCSPKGYDSFRILNEREVAYLDLTGSGIETVAHLQENGRIVLLFCSFEQTPRIVRLHGRGVVHAAGTPEFQDLMAHFEQRPAMRSIIRVEVTRISDSCGFGVPRYEYLGDRRTLLNYWNARSAEAATEYQRMSNAASVDGLQGLTLEQP